MTARRRGFSLSPIHHIKKGGQTYIHPCSHLYYGIQSENIVVPSNIFKYFQYLKYPQKELTVLFIKNNELDVEIIDPSIDYNLLGSRYCTGGYIFQVKDKNFGNLLSGPQYPDPKFDVFHGQGAPEVFSIALNQELVEISEDVLVLGVGKVTRTSYIIPFHVRDNRLVKEFFKWDIEQTSDSLSFQTIHTFKNWQLLIKRKVTLIERTITMIKRFLLSLFMKRRSKSTASGHGA